MAIGTSIFHFKRYSKPYSDDCIFTDELTEMFLRKLSWETELEEFKGINTIILRRKGNVERLYTILKRRDKGFSLRRITKYIIKNNPNNINFDICNIILIRNKDKLYFTYSILT